MFKSMCEERQVSYMQRAGHQAQLSGLIEKAPPEAGARFYDRL